jgi:cytochrome o ubiquinol oxidase subunit II
MSRKWKIALLALLFVGAMAWLASFLWGDNVAVLNPKGWVAFREKKLMIFATWMMMIVVIPVFILTAVFSWKYREGHKNKYLPEWDHHHLAEWIWWGVPCVIIAVLGWITWTSSHELDPFKSLDTDKKPLTIQVVALQWKWLFIYPEQKIATLNFVQFPEKTPIRFEVTADAPMNSFWIPQLGSQIYAMPGMKTQVHLIADEVGTFRGSSANLSGEGFSSMKFFAKAMLEGDFTKWVASVKKSSKPLTLEEYNALVEPKANVPTASYTLRDTSLYDQIVMKYMMPSMSMEKENK